MGRMAWKGDGSCLIVLTYNRKEEMMLGDSRSVVVAGMVPGKWKGSFLESLPGLLSSFKSRSESGSHRSVGSV